jgi:hypothetical protein
LLGEREGHTRHRANASGVAVPRSQQTRCMQGCVLYGTREVQAVGNGTPLAKKGDRHDVARQAVWKSDEVIVAMKRTNNAGVAVAESVERRASAERSLGGHAVAGTQRPAESDVGLVRVREAARWNRSLRFDNLLHHVTHRFWSRPIGRCARRRRRGSRFTRCVRRWIPSVRILHP